MAKIISIGTQDLINDMVDLIKAKGTKENDPVNDPIHYLAGYLVGFLLVSTEFNKDVAVLVAEEIALLRQGK